MTPFQVRRERFSEVFLLYDRLRKYKPKEIDNKSKKNFIPITDYKKGG